nr:alpha/beta hydrolase family protein [Corynebacterium freneyi]
MLLAFPPTGFIPDGVLDVSAASAAPLAEPPTAPPVVCLHGTVANGGNWAALAQLLLARGRVAVTPTYGNRGTAPLADNRAEVTRIVRRTLELTGADRVDLVGHSQGGLLAGLVVADVLDDDVVRRVICMSGTHRGVRMPRGVPMSAISATFGPALADQVRLRRQLLAGSGLPEVARAVRDRLNADGAAGGTVGDGARLPRWFDLVSDADHVVPPDCALTPDEYPGATTIRLEDRLGRGVAHHLQPHDRGVAGLVAELLG